jgi:DNA-binding transcriptional LysR family regulator
MNIKQIETFVRIVELGSFQAAATVLFASPSTVSARIKELERYIGIELFDRSFHRAQLTPKGHEFHAHAQQLVAFTTSLSGQIRAPQAMTGLVRLGVVGVVANTWLPGLVGSLRDTYPLVTLRIDVHLTRWLMERLAEGKLDLAIVAGPVSDPELHCEVLGYDQFVWMASGTASGPGQVPLEGTEPLTPAALARHPVLSLTEESHHYPVVRNWFREGGVSPSPAATCNNMNVLAALTMQGLGVSLLPRHGYREALAAGRLRELATTPPLPQVGFSMVYRKQRIPALGEALVRLARAASGLHGSLPEAAPGAGPALPQPPR